MPTSGSSFSRGSSMWTAIRSWRRFVWRIARRSAARAASGSPRRLEIRDQKHDRAPVQDVIDDIERLDGVGADALRLVVEDVPHDAQHVPAAFLRRQIAFDPVGVEHQADLVAVADGGKCQHAGELRGQIALCSCAPDPKFPEALMSTSRNIVSSRSSVNFLTNGRPARAVTFQSMVRTSSPGTVFAHLVEVHAPALEDRVVCARQAVVDQAARADLELPHARSGSPCSTAWHPPSERSVQGTGSVFRIFSIDVLGGDVLGLGLVGHRHAVAQHVERDRLDVLRRDEVPAIRETPWRARPA